MSYIGKTPTVGNFIKLDAITTSATNSYTLQHNSVNFSPESALHMMVSLNGVIQAPNTSYTVSGSTITFLPSSGTLSSSDSIDFIMVYGNILDLGVASSVTDSSITKGKLNLISDSSSAGLTVKGDGSSENGTIQLNCSQNSHGVKVSSPAHSSGQSYEMILPTTNITAGKFLKVDSVSGSGATGIGQLSFADAGGGFDFISNTALSSAGYLDINDVFSSTYQNYRIIGSGLNMATDNTYWMFQLNNSGGVQGSSYWWVGVGQHSTGSAVDDGDTNAGHWRIITNASATGQATNFDMTVYRPQAGLYSSYTCLAGGRRSGGVSHNLFTSGFQNSTTSFTGFRIAVGSGNISAGNITVFGIKDS